MSNKPLRILITGGGTGGHVFPAIAIADAVMSLDNVLAISAASHGNVWLFIFGLLLSVPLIIFGSQIITGIIDRFPIFIWLGAALLGWIAGSMFVDDIWIVGWLKANASAWVMPNPKNAAELLPIGLLHYGAAAIGAGIVIVAAHFVKQRRAPAH